MKHLVLNIFLLISFQAVSQVEIDRNIILNGTNANDRQVKGLNQNVDSTNLVSASTYHSGKIHYAEAMAFSPDSILLTSPLQLAAYSEGLLFTFMAPTANRDSIYVNINNLGWVRLKQKNRMVNSRIYAPGQALQVLYDGSSFQVVSALDGICPEGFTEVHSQYCIEQNEHAATTYFNAVVDCQSKKGRLCSWNEWYYACQKSSLGLSNMINNYEWVESAANSNHQVLAAGNTGCQVAAVPADSSPRNYRCCYSK